MVKKLEYFSLICRITTEEVTMSEMQQNEPLVATRESSIEWYVYTLLHYSILENFFFSK